MIVCTADKPGYTLFSQHTMKISSDCNRKVIICLITHFLHEPGSLSEFLQGIHGFLTEGKAVGFLTISPFSFKCLFCLIKMHALVSLQSQREWRTVNLINYLEPLTVQWKKQVNHIYSNIGKIPLIEQHSQYSVTFTLHWPLMTTTIH